METFVQTSETVRTGEPDENHCFDGFKAGTTIYTPETIVDSMHFHENPTVCFLLRGGGVEIKGRARYERHAGDIRFYHGGEPHRSVIKFFPSRCVNLDIEFGFLGRYGLSENLVAEAIAYKPDAKFLMLKIYGELTEVGALTAESIKISLLALLSERKESSGQKKPAWIKQLHELLNDRWSEKLSLDELSTAINVHPVTISKHFARYYSCTLGEYVRKLRVARSIALIKNTGHSLTEVALQCGFADQSHFIRNFKKFTGLLPKEFKKL